MRSLTLIFLIFFFTLFTQTLTQAITCSSASTTLSYYPCTIGYETCTDSYSQYSYFYVSYCTYRQCVFDIYSSCLFTVPVSLTDSQCASKCCQTSLSNSYFTQSTLDQCITTNENLFSPSKVKIYVIIICSVIGGILFLTFLCCICRNKEQYAACCRRIFCCEDELNDMDADANGSKIAQTINWQKVTVENENIHQPPTSKDFLQKPQQEGICCICLEQNTNCYTSCRHQFHILCLKEWITKKKTCPLCTNKEFNPLKITCQSCYLKVLSYCINLNPLPSQISGKKISCDDCSRHAQDFAGALKQQIHLKTHSQSKM